MTRTRWRPPRLSAGSCGPVVVALCVLFARHAGAGGIQLMERGTRAMARGGAAIASADDLNAAYLNPAALVRVRGLAVDVETALVDWAVQFERWSADSPRADCCAPTSSQVAYLNPSAAVAYGAQDGRWAVALSGYGPFAGATEYPMHSAARYAIVDQDNGLASAQLSGAWQAIPSLSVGVGLQLRQFWMRQQLMASVYTGVFGGPEDPDLDALLDVRVQDSLHPAWVAGLLYSPLPGVDLAASYQSAMDAEAEGTLSVQIPSHYAFQHMQQDGERLLLRTGIPDMLRVGARYAHRAHWDVEIAAVWERWSRHESILSQPLEPIRFTDVPGIGEFAVRDIELVERFEDTLSLRLGGGITLLSGRLALRGGAFVENGAAPDATVNAGSYDARKLGLGAGATVAVGPLEIDVAYGHVFFESRSVRTSERRQVNPLYTVGETTEGPTIIGNGDYGARLRVVSMALRWRL